MLFHPHLHCIVTGGGLSSDGKRWVAPKDAGFLFPLNVIGALFRGKFLDALRRAYQDGMLRLHGPCADLAHPEAFARFTGKLYRTQWITFVEAPQGGPGHLFQYLSRYIYRVAISDQRLIGVDSQSVTFLSKDGNTCTLDGSEFVYRFVQHVLPQGFVKTRHYGLYASSNVHTRLSEARAILEHRNHPERFEIVVVPMAAQDVPSAMQALLEPLEKAALPSPLMLCSSKGEAVEIPTWQEQLQQLTGVDMTRCPRCQKTSLRRLPLPSYRGPSPRSRSPPTQAACMA